MVMHTEGFPREVTSEKLEICIPLLFPNADERESICTGKFYKASSLSIIGLSRKGGDDPLHLCACDREWTGKSTSHQFQRDALLKYDCERISLWQGSPLFNSKRNPAHGNRRKGLGAYPVIVPFLVRMKEAAYLHRRVLPEEYKQLVQ